MFEQPLQFEEEAPGQVYCNDCTHLIGRRVIHEQAIHWKCAAKPNVLAISKDLVTGRTVYHYKHETCYASREAADGCGSGGRWFEKYEPLPAPKHHSPYPSREKGGKPSAEDLLSELGV